MKASAWMRRFLVGTLLGLAATACGGSVSSAAPSSADAAASCAPGESRACTGPGSCQGAQSCGASGHWLACGCSPGVDAGSGGQGGNPGSIPTDSNEYCPPDSPPNTERSCVGPGGCTGSQYCDGFTGSWSLCACGAPDASVCPSTCAELGADCGQVYDTRCAGFVQCGSCPSPEQCGAAKPNKCGLPDACVPRTCADLGFNCGLVNDGCGGSLHCGSCAPPQTCGGAGTPGQCG